MSLSSRTLFALVIAIFSILANAAVVEYNWDITWTKGNPDGKFERTVIGVNNQWPPPILYATKGDQVKVHVTNKLGNMTTALHFHGIFQNGTTHMDGATGATQCAIPIDSTFTYDFKVDQPGTYWWHSHIKGQYPEGIRAPLIVHDPDSPYKGKFDEEIYLTFSDWYYESPLFLAKHFLSVENPSGAEPVPDAALMNDTQNLKINIKPGKTYMFRMVNMAAFAAQHVWFEGHTMRVVEVDGVYTEPMDADMLYITAAQRYSVLVTMKNDTSTNFPIMGSMDEDLFDVVPDTLNPNVTSWLVYDDTKPFPDAKPVDAWNDFDDFALVPVDKQPRLDNVKHTVTLEVVMNNLKDGANYAFFNDVTYKMPKVPTVFSALTLGENATKPEVYGVNTNAFVLEAGEVVEIIVNNADPGKHPFHLHGHNFQVVSRSAEEYGFFNGSGNDDTPAIPMKRDTILVRPNGNLRLRFVADNPGIWLFHCHIEWHVFSGLVSTFVESPLALQKSLKIPDDHMAACKALGVPTAGNAAGNTIDPFNLDGANVPVGPIPSGFTARGIVALVFSILAAFIGMAFIAWYGWAPLKST